MFNALIRFLAVAILAGLFSSSVFAQCPRWTSGPLSVNNASPNGSVLAMTTWDPDGAGPGQPLLVIGGTFTSVSGVAANRIAAFNGFHWSPLGSGCNSDVRALGVFNGQLIAGGDFTSAGGLAVNHIARWNGSSWQNLGTGTVGGSPSGRVSALAVFNNELVVGGSFTAAGGLANNCIARWNGSTWAGFGSGMAISGNSPRVECLTVFEGQLYAGGFFTSVSGVLANNIARWSGSMWSKLGFANFTNNGANGLVRCFLIHDFGGTTGELLVVGGSFTQVSTGIVTSDTPAVALWSGSNWFAAGPGLPGATVGGLVDVSSGFLAGGFFPGSFGSIAHYDDSLNQWEPLNGGIELGSVQCMSSYNRQFVGNQIWAGGSFQGAGGLNINNLVEVSDGQFEFLPWDLGFVPFAYAKVGSRLIAGGYGWQQVGANAIDNIMAWNGLQVSPLGTGLNGFASAMAPRLDGSSTTSLVVGGAFSIAGGAPANNIALWTEDNATSTGSWSALGAGFNNEVLATTVFRNQFVAGGFFTMSGSTVVNGIARWNGSTWNPLTTGVSGNGRVFSMTTRLAGTISNPQHQLIIGGDFTTAGGLAVHNIAAWFENEVQHPLNGWITFGSGFNGRVFALTMHSGSLYAGGEFTLPGNNGSTPLNHIARWTGTAWVQVGTGLPSNVNAMLSSNGFLYAVISGQSPALMKWDGSTWTTVRSGPQSADGTTNLFALTAYHNEIHLGGTFDDVNAGVASPGWARYLETGEPWIVNQPDFQAKACGSFAHFTVQSAAGYSDVTFSWNHDGVPLSNGASGHGSTISGADAATLAIFNIQNADAGEYQCVVANQCGSETSAPASLIVTTICCPGDLTGNQFVDIDDLLECIGQWGPCSAPNGCNADIAPPGGNDVIDLDDLLVVINGWGQCE